MFEVRRNNTEIKTNQTKATNVVLCHAKCHKIKQATTIKPFLLKKNNNKKHNRANEDKKTKCQAVGLEQLHFI